MDSEGRRPHRFRKFLFSAAGLWVAAVLIRHFCQQASEPPAKLIAHPAKPAPQDPGPTSVPVKQENDTDDADTKPIPSDSMLSDVETISIAEVDNISESIESVEPKLDLSESKNESEESEYQSKTGTSDNPEAKAEIPTPTLPEPESDLDQSIISEISELEATLTASVIEDLETEIHQEVERKPPTGIAPLEGGECPLGNPIKARFSTGRYHLPEDSGYEKVVADSCYATVEEAEADGFTHSQW